MSNKIFSILASYKPGEARTSEENYTTELLSYILAYSIKIKSTLFIEFMKLLNYEFTIEDLDYITICTQKLFKIEQNIFAIPDITINYYDKKYIFIEVKIEAAINQYEISENEIIDQLKKYERIVTKQEKEICLLTKYYYCRPNIKKIRWYRICQLLEDYKTSDTIEEYLKKSFLYYLEEAKMSLPKKVGYEIINGVESLKNLMHQLEFMLEGYDTQKSFGSSYLGYYLVSKKSKEKKLAWVGTYYDGAQIILEVMDQACSEKIINESPSGFLLKREDGKKIVHSIFNFEDNVYFCLKPERQVEELKKWFDEKMEIILDIAS